MPLVPGKSQKAIRKEHIETLKKKLENVHAKQAVAIALNVAKKSGYKQKSKKKGMKK
jgi:hypothetical protein